MHNRREGGDILHTPPPTRLPLRILNFLAYLATVTANALAAALPLWGRSTGAISDGYPNLFVPAGLTFSIWGVIYLLLGIYAVFQLVGYRPFIERIGRLYLLASLANIGWILAWHALLPGLSLAIMLVLLLALVAIYLKLFIGRSTGSAAEKWLVHVCFSVYLGWITIATVANVTAVLVHLGWGRFGLSEVGWTIAVIVVATLVTLLVIYRRGDFFYGLVVLWALLGIILKRTVLGGERGIVTAAAVCMGLIASLGAVRARKYLSY